MHGAQTEPRAFWVTRRPAPLLAGLVGSYTGYRLWGFPAGVHRGLPSRHLTLIVSIGPQTDVVAQSSPGQAAARYRVVVGGLQAAPTLIAHDGYQEGVAIELSPLGSRALLGVPAAALYDLAVELEDVVGRAGSELWERLQEPAGWDERFAIVDEVLCRLLLDDRVEPALARAWQLIAGTPEGAPVGEVAQRIGWSRQHFARRFSGEFGLTPKLASRVVRFDRARWQLLRPGAGSIGDVAMRCGYYDQAHMTRDFVELAGLPPGRLLDEEDLPSVQDEPAIGRE